MKKLLFLFLISFVIISCSNDYLSCSSRNISNIKISYSIKRFYIANEYKLSVEHKPSNENAPNYIWETSNPDKATITKNGILQTKGLGTVVIRVHIPHTILADSILINIMEQSEIMPPDQGESSNSGTVTP